MLVCIKYQKKEQSFYVHRERAIEEGSSQTDYIEWFNKSPYPLSATANLYESRLSNLTSVSERTRDTSNVSRVFFRPDSTISRSAIPE